MSFEDLDQAWNTARVAVQDAEIALGRSLSDRNCNPDQLLLADRLVAAAKSMVDEGQRLYG